ncbi:MAG: hypothetical protein KDK99_10040 [Verrucomicrobiales bacterium]|nr:hypothetical protein [Verrucomicrobiales bacterium]
MSSRALSSREKRLLAACFIVLILMASIILARGFLDRRTALLSRISSLEEQQRENEMWLADRAFWVKRANWLEDTMPSTESLGRAQGQLLEEIQNAALDRKIKVEQQTLLEPETNGNYREVAVSLRLYGEQTTVLQWLTTLQSPEKFQLIKELDFELDTRSREPKPQARCNLTVARWFKPEPSA